MTNPELAPDMPEEISVKKEMMTRGHYNYDVIGHGNIDGYTTYRRADLAPQAGSVDVEDDVLTCTDGHKEPCVLCGVECDRLAANPGVWPKLFPKPDGTGVCLVHCTECVVKSVYPNLLNPGPQGWQPIETAPKDGTHILLWGAKRGKNQHVVGYWGYHGEWVSSPGQYGARQITHWMPLPSPPNKETEGG